MLDAAVSSIKQANSTEEQQEVFFRALRGAYVSSEFHGASHENFNLFVHAIDVIETFHGEREGAHYTNAKAASNAPDTVDFDAIGNYSELLFDSSQALSTMAVAYQMSLGIPRAECLLSIHDLATHRFCAKHPDVDTTKQELTEAQYSEIDAYAVEIFVEMLGPYANILPVPATPELTYFIVDTAKRLPYPRFPLRSPEVLKRLGNIPNPSNIPEQDNDLDPSEPPTALLKRLYNPAIIQQLDKKLTPLFISRANNIDDPTTILQMFSEYQQRVLAEQEATAVAAR